MSKYLGNTYKGDANNSGTNDNVSDDDSGSSDDAVPEEVGDDAGGPEEVGDDAGPEEVGDDTVTAPTAPEDIDRIIPGTDKTLRELGDFLTPNSINDADLILETLKDILQFYSALGGGRKKRKSHKRYYRKTKGLKTQKRKRKSRKRKLVNRKNPTRNIQPDRRV